MEEVILSGMRPTGRLQLGNLFGALNTWLELQENEENKCYFSVVDWHALTTAYEDTSEVKSNIKEIVIDWLSAGIDPGKSIIFKQSDVVEHAELFLLFSMFTPLPWLERCPTYKDQMQQLKGKDLSTYGFLGYPLLQAADILIYRATAVPVGEDQAPHIEMTREIARRFNFLYKKVFPEPKTLLNEYKVLPGLDGRKMSKSYNNTINLSASPEEIKKKVKMMVTDTQRIRKNDPGNPNVCSVYKFQSIFNKEFLAGCEDACRQGIIGCVDCKNKLAQKMIVELQPIHEKRKDLEGQEKYINEILHNGGEEARKVARDTMIKVREAMGL